jgi:glucosamine-6-phosphate deaminase
MPARIVEVRADAERAIASELAELVRAKPDLVLGLPTGKTPVGVYRELVRFHRDEGLDFSRVRTFNLDEYLGIGADHEASFAHAMQEMLFDHVNVTPANVHFLDGLVALDRAEAHCSEFERAIESAGGIDLLLLGIGRNGHIAFNEPGSSRDSRTRVVELDEMTRADAAVAFGGIANVPRQAITMGVATMLGARRLRVMAFGATKAECVQRAVVQPVGPKLPATFLRGHPSLVVWFDVDAAAALAGHDAR